MAVVVVCLVLLVVGVAVAARWGHLAVESPDPVRSGPGRPPAGAVLRRYLWWLTVWTVAALASGVLAAGAGGRLVMRLLAHTSPAARGRLTDADQVVGRISVEGTLGLLVFSALPAGMLAALLYLLVRRALPPGRWRPVALSVILLVLVSVRIDPLRPDNIDFAILEPTWLALVTFCLLAVLHAAVVVALAGVYSRSLPEFGRQSLGWYTPLLVWLLVYPVGVLVCVVAAVVVGLSRVLPARRPSVPGGVVTGRVLLVAAAAVALPGFVVAVQDILAR